MIKRTRILMVGCGGMARYHIKEILQQQDTSEIAGICEPVEAMLDAASALFQLAETKMPPTYSTLDQALRDRPGEFDVAFIITPHAYHLEQATACLEAGLDLLLEKPMVMNANEARALIETRDRTGRLLVVAFPGSLSPQIRTAVKMLRAGELGTLLNINGVVWQNWKSNTAGTWRQQPEISGGGFLFDTGAHLLNTATDLAGEEFTEVAAWLDNRDAPVDILGAIIARLKSGAYVTLTGCGDAFPSCASDVHVICTGGMLRTGIWGERLERLRAGGKSLRKVKVPASLGVWQQFIQVRAGVLENPCPPEVGLRMARLWDAVQASARDGGQPVRVQAETASMN